MECDLRDLCIYTHTGRCKPGFEETMVNACLRSYLDYQLYISPPNYTPPTIIPTSPLADSSGAETQCSMYRPRYCAGVGKNWKESSEANQDKCAKCTRKEILKEKKSGFGF